MKSYELVELMTNDNIAWTFDELKQLPTSLYDLNKCEIENINDFIEYKQKEEK